MPLATFKDLCIDANDVELLGRFWATVLDLELDVRDDGVGRLTGPSRFDTVWVNPVPEPKSVKHRVHLDVHVGSVADLERLGARVLDAREAWTVMADPEGGEFCAFVRDEVPERRLYEVGVDVIDGAITAAWWQGVIGGEVGRADDASWLGAIPGTPFDALTFSAVPERKSGKNRVHLDLFADDPDALVAAGATLLRRPDDEIAWTVMADPDGNEFCVFARS